MAAVEGSNSDESDFQDKGENNSGSESDISVSTVNTEDLSSLEDEDTDCEVGWSRDPTPVNTTPFTSRTGAASGISEDGTAEDFYNRFVSDEVFEACGRNKPLC